MHEEDLDALFATPIEKNARALLSHVCHRSDKAAPLFRLRGEAATARDHADASPVA
jgi:hypothetical protein